MIGPDWEIKKPLTRERLQSLVSAVPGFRESWEKFLQRYENEPPPWYLAIGELAHYVVTQYACDRTSEFADLFAAVEELLNTPDPEVKSLISVGLFEDIQNICSHRGFNAEVFCAWLGPRSFAVWQEVAAFWDRVAVWMRDQPRESSFDPERVLSRVENPELKKLIESMYRARKNPGSEHD